MFLLSAPTVVAITPALAVGTGAYRGLVVVLFAAQRRGLARTDHPLRPKTNQSLFTEPVQEAF